MKKLLGTAAVLAGMTFGVSIASANPAIDCGCTLFLRNGTLVNFPVSALEELQIRRAESGDGAIA